MPELPEVETVRRGLEPTLEGARIIRAVTKRPALRYPFPKNLAAILQDRTIESLSRRAKYLLLHLDNGQTLISHLGMSGSWRIEEGQKKPKMHGKNALHDHFIMDVETAKGQLAQVIYNDPRRFGFLILCETAQVFEQPMLKKLGIEPTGNALSGAYLREKFSVKSLSLKAALLDQSLVAGLGNIYVCEALWRSKLSPFQKASALSAQKDAVQKTDLLAENIRMVIAEAIEAGGSSLRDYVHADGSLGYFQHRFSVYGREGAPCPCCNEPIKRLVQNGRSTFYCVTCQK